MPNSHDILESEACPCPAGSTHRVKLWHGHDGVKCVKCQKGWFFTKNGPRHTFDALTDPIPDARPPEYFVELERRLTDARSSGRLKMIARRKRA